MSPRKRSRILAGVLGRARLADDGDLDLPGILHGLLDLLADVARDTHGLEVVDLLWFDDDADLAPCLDRKRGFHALEVARDVFERFQAADVVFEGFAAGARPSAADGV